MLVARDAVLELARALLQPGQPAFDEQAVSIRSGQALHFIEGLRIVKDNLFNAPPLFAAIQRMSGTDWREMYKVFNMGHRLEFYVPAARAEEVIAISTSYGIGAKVIGRVETAVAKEVVLASEHGNFTYS